MEQELQYISRSTHDSTTSQDCRHISAKSLGIDLPPGYHILETRYRLRLYFGDAEIRAYPLETPAQHLERDAIRHAARHRASVMDDIAARASAMDPVTGLPWTPAVIDAATKMVAEADLHAICVHLTRLDALIDARGYRIVPAVFQRTAQALKPRLSWQDRLTRHSGDKFLIFTTRTLEEVEALVERIHQEIAAVAAAVGTDGLPQSQIGVASLPQETDPNEVGALIEALVISAEAASTATASQDEPLEGIVADDLFVPMSSGLADANAGSASGAGQHVEVDTYPELAHEAPASISSGDARPHFEEISEAQLNQPAPSEPLWVSAVTTPHVHHEESGAMPHSAPRAHDTMSPLEEKVANSGKRLVLVESTLDLAGHVATATVELKLGTRRVRGKAVGRNSEERRLPLVAEAAARAITEFLPRGYGVVIQHVDHAPAEVGVALWTLAFLLTPTGEQALLGIAPADSNFTRAAATCVLNAVNRRVGTLLGETN